MERRALLAGNWKMYKTPEETRSYFDKFLPLVEEVADRDIVICPPFTSIFAAVEASKDSNVRIGGQDLFWEKEGAFTGEVSGPMLKASGCSFVIVGHSERRQYFGETNEGVLKKTRAALESGLTPIVCVGETLAEREAGRTLEVLREQFITGLGSLNPSEIERVVIAYEPVWAIGTGRTATPETAQEAQHFLRTLLVEVYGVTVAEQVRILYGGSVKPSNIASLMAMPDIDGALVGGASLDPESFAAIVKYDYS